MLLASAGRDLSIASRAGEVATTGYGKNRDSKQCLDTAGVSAGGNLILSAGRDVQLTTAPFEAGQSAAIVAGRDAVIQVKRSYSAVDKPKNFLSKSTRTQIKETIRLAEQQGKRAEFWFKYGVHPDVRLYIEQKGGRVVTGLGD